MNNLKKFTRPFYLYRAFTTQVLLLLLLFNLSFSESTTRLQENGQEVELITENHINNSPQSNLLRSKKFNSFVPLEEECPSKCQSFIKTTYSSKVKKGSYARKLEEVQTSGSIPFAFNMILIVVLVLFSGLFSGLTLGLMTLDKTGLEIVMEGDDAVAAKNASTIYPVRSNGNLLLTTLLLGNVSVNALLSIIMADITSGMVGFLVSTAVIVVFGEILPQAVCSRYALQIGSKTVPLVRVIIFLLYVIAAPLAFALDKILGRELATVYSKSEMVKLIQIHVDKGMFNKETGVAMTGALKYKDLLVKNVMTPLENVFMLNADARLNFDCLSKIFKAGYSRIPVYEITKNNVIGLLFTKDLIFLDPEDGTSVKNMMQLFGRGVHVVWPDDKLGEVLHDLKKGKSHMALVRDVNNTDETQDPFYEIKGIITLEDIIEEILGDEIVDETDAFVDTTHSVKVDRENFDWGRLTILDSKITHNFLNENEVRAVMAHLRTNFSDAMSLLSDVQLNKFIATTPVSEISTAEQTYGEALPKDLLYEKGVLADTCTLILSGKVAVMAGLENFKSDVSSWSMLAIKALTDKSYIPDFSAFVSHGPCRCIQLSRERFTAAVDASAVEKIASSSVHTPDPPTESEEEEDVDDMEVDLNPPVRGFSKSYRKQLAKSFRAKSSPAITGLDTRTVNYDESHESNASTATITSKSTESQNMNTTNPSKVIPMFPFTNPKDTKKEIVNVKDEKTTDDANNIEVGSEAGPSD